MDINRDDIRKLVEIFYQSPFKTFYVNSIDGKEFIKPVGVFVSLGLTTSMATLCNIRDILNNTPEYNAKIVEIASTRVSGQFMNRVTEEVNPKQIYIDKTGSEHVMDYPKALKELENLKNYIHPDQDLKVLHEYAPRISKLQGLIDRLNNENGWDSNWIQKMPNGDYKPYHRYVNYVNCGDVEYRIGIFVSQK